MWVSAKRNREEDSVWANVCVFCVGSRTIRWESCIWKWQMYNGCGLRKSSVRCKSESFWKRGSKQNCDRFDGRTLENRDRRAKRVYATEMANWRNAKICVWARQKLGEERKFSAKYRLPWYMMAVLAWQIRASFWFWDVWYLAKSSAINFLLSQSARVSCAPIKPTDQTISTHTTAYPLSVTWDGFVQK